jgi:hypothetical protein
MAQRKLLTIFWYERSLWRRRCRRSAGNNQAADTRQQAPSFQAHGIIVRHARLLLLGLLQPMAAPLKQRQRTGR